MLNLDQRYSFRGQSIAWGRIGDGAPLVLVHGTPFSSHVWRRIAPWLARRRTVYFFDLLGYGASEMREEQDVSLGVQNHLFAELIAHWGLQRPEVIAHDFGGATTLRAYYLNGLRFSRMTLIDPVALTPWGSPFVQHVRRYQEAFAGLPPYAHDALLAAYLQGASFAGLDAKAIEIYSRPWRGLVGQAAFYRQIAQMDQRYTLEIEPMVGPPDCPLSIIWGDEDQWIPVSIGAKLAARMTGGVLVRVPGAGHLVQDDAPEAILATVLA